MKYFACHWFATGLGVGYAPAAPGTFGSLLAFPLLWFFDPGPSPLYGFLFCLIFTFVSWVIIAVDEGHSGDHDSSSTVIDEVVGQCITVMFCPRSICFWVTGFVIFRTLDVWKPWLIGWIDRELPGAAGTLLDDVLAGVVGAGLMFAVTGLS